MFRPGNHLGFTLLWSDPEGGPDRLVGMEMSQEASVGIAGLLNLAVDGGCPDWVATLPMVPRREDV
jgi:hypothetical protein